MVGVLLFPKIPVVIKKYFIITTGLGVCYEIVVNFTSAMALF